jgi:hypothetical protein
LNNRKPAVRQIDIVSADPIKLTFASKNHRSFPKFIGLAGKSGIKLQLL